MTDKKRVIKLYLGNLQQSEATATQSLRAPRKSAREYRRILDSLDDVVFILDKDGRFLFVNKASERRTGVPTEALIGRHFSEIVEPQYKGIAQSSFQREMGGEKEPPLEMEFQKPSGENITVEVTWKALHEDNVAVRLLGASRDVTDRKLAQEELKRVNNELEKRVRERTKDLRKANELLRRQIDERIRAEEKLKASEQKYRGLFENSGDAVIIADTETGNIIDGNRQAEMLTGHSRQELIGMHQSLLHPSEDEEYYRDKFQKHIKNEAVFDIEAEVVRKDGEVVPVFISSSTINLQGKTIIQTIFRDISKEKMISDLKDELNTKKLVNRAKSIISKRYQINDTDALKLLQRESRRQRRKLKEVAQAVISSKFILD